MCEVWKDVKYWVNFKTLEFFFLGGGKGDILKGANASVIRKELGHPF